MSCLQLRGKVYVFKILNITLDVRSTHMITDADMCCFFNINLFTVSDHSSLICPSLELNFTSFQVAKQFVSCA